MTEKSTPAARTEPLVAAQKIVTELQGMSPEDQSLALQFAMQSLRLQTPASLPSVAPASPLQDVQDAPAARAAPVQSTDIKSFTEAKAPQSDQQFTAVVAYYYQFEAKPSDRKDAIDTETMKEAARLAGRPQVKRWAMTLTNAKNAGYLNSAGHGKYTLSPVGENLVAITLPGKAARGGASNSGAGRKKRTKKTAGKKKGTAKKSLSKRKRR